MCNGRDRITDIEILAIVIGRGTRKYNCIELAEKILNEFNNDLTLIARLTIPDLMKVEGLGQFRATQILAAFELGRRRTTELLKK
jgi:DNA repair protein RadC